MSRTSAPIITVSALEHTPLTLSSDSGYQIIEHPAVKEVIVFFGDRYCGAFDDADQAQAYIDAHEQAVGKDRIDGHE